MKALISFAVTAKLICVFVFAYAKKRFSQNEAHILYFTLAAEVPYGYRLQFLHGFVEELVVNDDPEYQWIDKIRTPRSSNEARQRLFSKMSGEPLCTHAYAI